VYRWDSNRDAAFDVVVTSPLQSAFLLKSARLATADAALEAAVKKKDDKSFDILNELQKDFIPLAFTTFGNFTGTVTDLIKQLVYMISDRTGVPRSKVGARLRQRLSLGIQRFNAVMLLSRAPVDFGS